MEMLTKLKMYDVQRFDRGNFNITGNGNNPLWDKVIELTDFCSPWSTEPTGKVSLKSFRDYENIYFLFKVDDSNIFIDRSDNSKRSINNSDRVEIFFRSDGNLNPYYCLEIDPISRLMDFKAKPNKEFDFTWNWPKDDISIKSDITNNYFSVEISISLASLLNLNLLTHEERLEIGIYRAKYCLQQNGEYKPIWISWVNPKTETPNFHIASSFGIFNFI